MSECLRVVHHISSMGVGGLMTTLDDTGWFVINCWVELGVGLGGVMWCGVVGYYRG